jgi:hypothetical protein
MSGSRVKETAPHRLIVEGPDDQHSIIHLTARHGWDWDNPKPHYPYIEDARGVDPALKALPVAALSCTRVGIVLDADDTPDNRWKSVSDRLAGTAFRLPEQPDPAGTVVEANGGKRLGVWLMPDNLSRGKLEDFLAILVPPSDPCWPWSEESTERAKNLGAAFKDSDFVKARIYTWLAWQEKPGLTFGTAIKAATFAHDAELACRFVAWMERLFD